MRNCGQRLYHHTPISPAHVTVRYLSAAVCRLIEPLIVRYVSLLVKNPHSLFILLCREPVLESIIARLYA